MSVGFIYNMLNQTATYWAPEGHTQEGASRFAAPVRIRCRWEDRTDLFVDSQGEEKRSEALVYVDRQLKVAGYLMFGYSMVLNPLNEDEAHEIKARRSIPDIASTDTEYSVYL